MQRKQAAILWGSNDAEKGCHKKKDKNIKFLDNLSSPPVFPGEAGTLRPSTCKRLRDFISFIVHKKRLSASCSGVKGPSEQIGIHESKHQLYLV